MKLIEAILNADPKNKRSVTLAANAVLSEGLPSLSAGMKVTLLLAEDTVVKVGGKVTTADDTIHPVPGQPLTVKSITNGIATCTTESGAEVDVLTNLLFPI